MSKIDNKVRIAKTLADGQFHSGEVLGRSLGISRAAVANHVKNLNELGLDVFSVPGKGYRLSQAISMLKEEQIADGREETLEVHSIIDSTNEYIASSLRNGIKLKDGHTVVAECQTSGRGRRGRQWQSPFGSHIYFSQYRSMEDGLAAAAGLSLAIGVAVRRACAEICNVDYRLKWPNDILVEGKKLAGILVEAEGQSDGACHLVIGIGINIKMPTDAAKEIDQPWTDLTILSGDDIDRNKLVKGLIKQMDLVLQEYRVFRLDNLHEEWNQHNAFQNAPVKVISNTNEKRGKCLGIDASGAMLLEDSATKKVTKIFGGEVSLRADK